jgi:hypothetical protein
MPLSLLALAVLGSSNAMSVVIQRGRVTSVDYLFVGSSNTLGEFESGVVAAWLGPVASVFIAGIGSLAVAGLWMLFFPARRRIDRFQRFQPADKGA